YQQQAMANYNAMLAQQQAQQQAAYAQAAAGFQASLLERQAMDTVDLARQEVSLTNAITEGQMQVINVAHDLRERDLHLNYRKTQSTARAARDGRGGGDTGLPA